jgi:hypothetical protein
MVRKLLRSGSCCSTSMLKCSISPCLFQKGVQFPRLGDNTSLVDDEHDITFSIRIGLENNGFAVDAFNDPQEALSNFRALVIIVINLLPTSHQCVTMTASNLVYLKLYLAFWYFILFPM